VKIIRVTMEQFLCIWDRLTPMQRVTVGERSIVLQPFDTILTASDDVEVLEFPPLSNSELSITKLRHFASKGTLDGFTPGKPPRPMSEVYAEMAKSEKAREDRENAGVKP